MWKVFYSLLLINPIHNLIAQDIVKPSFKLKTVSILEKQDKGKTFVNYPSFNSKEDIDHNDVKKENQSLYDEIKKQNELLAKLISRDKKAKKKIKEETPYKDFSFSYPLKTIYITSGYGYRIHPITNKTRFHYGIDIRAKYEPVKTVLDGVVVQAKRSLDKGRYICIKSNEIEFRYYHLEEIHVRKGQKVNAGEIIGKSGNSGLSNAPHLHLEALVKGEHINPNTLLIKLNNLKKE